MRWIAPTGNDNATATLDKRVLDAADQFRANSWLKPQQYFGSTLGPIFLRFAECLRRRPHDYELCSESVRP